MKKQRIAAWYGVVLVLIASLALSGCNGGGGGSTSLSAEKAITAFSFTSPAATGTVDENAKTIAVTVPDGTNVTALSATFTTTGASVKVGSTEQVSGTTPNDFTSPVIYTVTAADSTTATYTVTVTGASGVAKTMTAFSFTSPAAMGILDGNAKAIAVSVPHDTNVTALVATFATTGTSVKVGSTAQVSGTTPNDFTGPVAYTVTAADGTTETYTVTVTVAAIALPKTGQAICSDSTGTVIACTNTGQDGDLQKGVSWPGSRFTTSTDTSVIDNLTGLAWAPNANVMPTRDSGWDTDFTANDGKVTWQHALDYVAKLNAENYLGHNDWRLPNINEMRSLVNYEALEQVTWLTSQGFTNVQDYRYWSSTTSAGESNAWFVRMDFGGALGAVPKVNANFVWPVRAGEGIGIPADQPKTGQTICYDTVGTVIACANTGQDGDLQKGAAWPSPRFASLGDTTITDNLTGLAWAPNGNIMPTQASGWDTDAADNDGKVTWQHALDYVAKLNAENYLGHNDWRLPNVNEMATLVNASQYGSSTDNPAKWLNTQGFTNMQTANYWTSTTWQADSPYKNAWIVDLYRAGIEQQQKATSYEYVLPVRGGQ